MNMDKKIRRVCTLMTPNVLPAPERKQKKKRRIPGKLWEALPGVAAAAVLIVAVGLCAVNFEGWFGPIRQQSPVETAAQTQPTLSSEEEIARLKQELLAEAVQIVARSGEELTADIGQYNRKDYQFLATIWQNGINYQLGYKKTGELSVLKLQREPEAEGFISEQVAFHLVKLHEGQECRLQSVELRNVQEKLYYYAVTVSVDEKNKPSRYVDAQTGEIYLTEPDEDLPGLVFPVQPTPIDEEKAAEIALNYAHYTKEQVTDLTVSEYDELNYLVTFMGDGLEYHITVGKTNREAYPVMGVTGLSRLERFFENDPALPDDVKFFLSVPRQDGALQVLYRDNAAEEVMVAIIRRLEGRNWELLSIHSRDSVPADVDEVPAGMLTFRQAEEKAMAYLGQKEYAYYPINLGHRDGDVYTVLVDTDTVLKIVKVDAWSGDILYLNFEPLIEGGTHYMMESGLMMFSSADFNPLHQYASLEEMRIAQLLNSPLRDESDVPTDQERAELAGLLPGLDTEMLIRLSTEKLRELLRTRFDTTPEQLSDACFEGMVYLESTDCWYFTISGKRLHRFCFASDFDTDGNGLFRVTYWDSEETMDSDLATADRTHYEVVAEFVPGGTWRILSNTRLSAPENEQ